MKMYLNSPIIHSEPSPSASTRNPPPDSTTPLSHLFDTSYNSPFDVHKVQESTARK